MSSERIEIVDVPIPDTVESPDARPFIDAVESQNRAGSDAFGHDLEHAEAASSLVWWTSKYWDGSLLQLRLDGRPAGTASIRVQLLEGAKTAELDVQVEGWAQGNGVGTAALAELERRAAEYGRPVLQAFSAHRTFDGERLTARSGAGTVPADDRPTRFLRDRGWSLEQVYRMSAFALQGSDDLIARHLAAAEAKASPDYRSITWHGAVPDEWLDDVAVLVSRMSTDAPFGDLDVDEEVWDADRVRERNARIAASGDDEYASAAVHVPSGRLVAFSNFVTTPGTPPEQPAHQGMTLVLKEHRGHRLGMLVKAANLALLREAEPDRIRVTTYNAEENRPMLDVNEALGFEPVHASGAWQRKVGS